MIFSLKHPGAAAVYAGAAHFCHTVWARILCTQSYVLSYIQKSAFEAPLLKLLMRMSLSGLLRSSIPLLLRTNDLPLNLPDLGTDTHAVATEIEVTYSRYGLNNKVTKYVTDNGSKFVKALKEVSSVQNPVWVCVNPSELTFTDLHKGLAAATDDDDAHSICELPPHAIPLSSLQTMKLTNGRYVLQTQGLWIVVLQENLQHCGQKPAATRSRVPRQGGWKNR